MFLFGLMYEGQLETRIVLFCNRFYFDKAYVFLKEIQYIELVWQTLVSGYGTSRQWFV